MSAAPLVHARLLARVSLLPLALGAILVAGLALRLWDIDSRGLWGDEAWRVWAARLPSAFDVLRVAWAQPPAAPLYWLGLHTWIGAFGHSDVAVRLFSVPAALGVIAATYWLGRVCGGAHGPALGVLAAGLLAVAPTAVEVGQEATMYAWAMLLATLALAAGLAWLRSGRGAAAYVALSALLLYTHYLGALLLGELCLAGLIWMRWPAVGGGPAAGRPRRWLALHGLITLLWLPWLIPMTLRIGQRWDELTHLQHRAGWADLYGTGIHLSVGASADAVWPALLVALAVAGGGALLVLALAATRRAEGRLVWLVAALVLGFIAAIVGTSALTGAWLVQPRFLTLVLPALTMVLAAGPVYLFTAASPAFLRGLATLLLGGWLVAQGAGIHAFYTAPVHGHDGLREIGAWLSTAVQPGDLVVANHFLLPWFVAQYYNGPIQALPADQDVRDGYPLWPPPDTAALPRAQWAVLAPRAATARRIWLIDLPTMDPDGWLVQQIGKQYPQIAHRSYPLADVYLFAGPAPP